MSLSTCLVFRSTALGSTIDSVSIQFSKYDGGLITKSLITMDCSVVIDPFLWRTAYSYVLGAHLIASARRSFVAIEMVCLNLSSTADFCEQTTINGRTCSHGFHPPMFLLELCGFRLQR